MKYFKELLPQFLRGKTEEVIESPEQIRFQKLLKNARQSKRTVFEQIVKNGRFYRDADQNAVNYALDNGWKLRVQLAREYYEVLETSEITGLTLVDDTVMIAMLRNERKQREGSWVASYSMQAKNCELVKM